MLSRYGGLTIWHQLVSTVFDCPVLCREGRISVQGHMVNLLTRCLLYLMQNCIIGLQVQGHMVKLLFRCLLVLSDISVIGSQMTNNSKVSLLTRFGLSDSWICLQAQGHMVSLLSTCLCSLSDSSVVGFHVQGQLNNSLSICLLVLVQICVVIIDIKGHRVSLLSKWHI